MLDGVMLLWFVLTAGSVLFVAIDIRSTPESPVLKWGFVLLTLYTGPIGAFLYVLGCREPLPGLHERYVAATWRQVLGSTMHCVAGDGIGILAGAMLASALHASRVEELVIEYVLGFGFGWTIFQALFMRGMAGGSYLRSLQRTFMSELLSMNLLMAGMMPVAAAWRAAVPAANTPLAPEFWFAMSMALLVGFIFAYPMNWWLVVRGLKHGMMTVRPPGLAMAGHGAQHQDRPHDVHAVMTEQAASATPPALLPMALASLVALSAGLAWLSRFAAHSEPVARKVSRRRQYQAVTRRCFARSHHGCGRAKQSNTEVLRPH